MHRAVRSLLLLALLLGVAGAALPEREPLTRDDILKHNQEKLDEWKKEPAHLARLQRDLDRFWKKSPEERSRLRKLDQELHQQDSATQQKMWDVLERYHAWLERLSPADRRRVESAQGSERIGIIKELREQEYIRRLPPPQRDRVLALKGKERETQIARLREEQRQLELAGAPQPRPRLRVTEFNKLPPELQAAVKRLEKLLTKPEEKRLRMAMVSGRYPDYLLQLKQLARKHKIALPGLDAPGPVEVWDGLRSALPEVPERTLFHFVRNELSPEEQARLPLSSRDPVIREKLKERYFKKHPRELKRLQQLDVRPQLDQAD